MDKQLLIAVIGFATASLGLATALLGRRKEVVHRHVGGHPEEPRSRSALSWVGTAVMVLGVLVGAGMTAAYVALRTPADAAPDARPDAPAAKLLAGPLAGRLSTTAGQTTFAAASVTTRDSAGEATFFTPATPDGVFWSAAVYHRLPKNLLGSVGAGVRSDNKWYVNWFDEKGDWHPLRGGELPAGLLHTRKGDRNRVRVTVNGNRGQLFLNDQFLTEFDASDVIAPGDVAAVMTLTHNHGEHPNPIEMHYEDFRVTTFP